LIWTSASIFFATDVAFSMMESISSSGALMVIFWVRKDTVALSTPSILPT